MENIKKLLAVWGAAAVFFLGGIEAGAAGMENWGWYPAKQRFGKGRRRNFGFHWKHMKA